MATPALKAKSEQLFAIQKKVGEVMAKAKTDNGDFDFSGVKDHGIDGDNAKAVEVMKAWNQEMDKLAGEVADAKELCATEEKAKMLGEMFGRPAEDFMQPDDNGGSKDFDYNGLQSKTLGDHFIESNALKGWSRGSGAGPAAEIELGEAGVKQLLSGIKTTMSRSAGWAPESLRTGRVVDYATRPVQVIDVIPSTQTAQAAVKYMEETTFTNNAAEEAEAGGYSESAFALTERSVTVEKIAHYLPVTDEQLEDVGQVRGYVNNRLGFGLRQRLDGQLTNGDGNTPNLLGVLNKPSIQSQALGTDDQLDCIFKGMIKVRQTGRATPDTVMLEAVDYQDIRLKRTADGIYILGSPLEGDIQNIWGLQLVINDSLANGTGLVGDFGMFSELSIRRNITVQVGYSGTDFTDGKQSIRADMRCAAIWYRAAAFCKLTGI